MAEAAHLVQPITAMTMIDIADTMTMAITGMIMVIIGMTMIEETWTMIGLMTTIIMMIGGREVLHSFV